jgi:hypothetical protein
MAMQLRGIRNITMAPSRRKRIFSGLWKVLGWRGPAQGRLGHCLRAPLTYIERMGRSAPLLALWALALSTMPALAQGTSPARDYRQELQSLPPQELRAMRHFQTRDRDVRRLETERYGASRVERQSSQEKDEVDQLYQQVIRQSQELGAASR